MADPLNDKDPALAAALASLGPPEIWLTHRVIQPDDEDLLLAVEAPDFRTSVLKVRRQSGAARSLARELLAEFGFRDTALRRTDSGAIDWPTGMNGSLAHDDQVAVAAVARQQSILALGIDIEPAIPLRDGLARIIATPTERRRYQRSILESRLLFSLKEAVYKAQHPIYGDALDFQDVEIDLDARRGMTRTGRSFLLRFITAPRVVALAFVPAGPSV